MMFLRIIIGSCYYKVQSIVLIIIFNNKRTRMYLLKHKSPLQSTNGVNIVINRTKSTYTDNRIQEIKKKYDASFHEIYQKPIKERSVAEASKEEDKQNRELHREEPRKVKRQSKGIQNYIFTNRNKPKPKQMASQKETTLSCPNNERESKLWQKIQPFDLIEDNFIKSTINEKLNTNHSDPFFQKLSLKQLAQQNYFKSKDSYNKLLQKQCSDPRIENIQKINFKIKKILDCIQTCEKDDENEQQAEFAHVKERSSQLYRSSLGRSIISHNGKPDQCNQLQQTKIISAQKFYFEKSQPAEQRVGNRQCNLRGSNHRQYSSMRGNSHFSQYLNSYKNMLDEKKVAYNNDSALQKHKTQARYLSCYVKSSKQQSRGEERADLMGSKVEQINQQIQEFYSKIKQLQERKRKLKIKLLPSEFQGSPINKMQTDSMINEIKNRQEQHRFNSKAHQEPKRQLFRQIIVNGQSTKKQHLSPQAYQENKYSQSVQPNLLAHQAKMHIQHSPVRQLAKLQTDQQEFRAYNNEELRRKIEERFQQRRKRMQHIQHQLKQQSAMKETIRMVKVLCQQAKLDEQLRNSKNWFSECNYVDKDAILLAKLKQKGIVMSESAIKRTFYELNEEQTDPFFSFREQKCTIQSLVQFFVKCTQFWTVRLLKQWDIRQMINAENFLLHFNNKNCILIEDIVRLLNTQSGNFYRNRDVHMIFQRIRENSIKSGASKITIGDIQSTFQAPS